MDKMVRVMVTDNTTEFCEKIGKAIAEHEGMQLVGVANDGEEAIRMVERLKPDVLVLDLMLAKRDGLAVLRCVNKMDKRPMVIATSRFITDYVASSAANLGCRYLMLKPCDEYALIERIEEAGGWERQRHYRISESVKLETAVTEILHNIGVPAHIKGYQYLREAIIIASKDADVLNAVTKVLYPAVAHTFQTTESRVKTAMRYAVDIAWERGNPEALDKHFGYSQDKPRVSDFIASISDFINLRLRSGEYEE